MKKLISYLKTRLERCLQDRYGIDELSILLLCATAVLSFGTVLLRKTAVYGVMVLLTAIPAIWAVFRCLSHNISSRRSENDTYLKIRDEIVYQVSLRKKTREIKKSYKYFTCKACKCRYRVPRGQGKIQITCPNCKEKKVKRT